ncbi:hypothetical protein WN984_10605 [Streptomyces noursei]
MAHRPGQLPLAVPVVVVDQHQPAVPYDMQVVGREPRALQYGGDVEQRLHNAVQPGRVRPGHAAPAADRLARGR